MKLYGVNNILNGMMSFDTNNFNMKIENSMTDDFVIYTNDLIKNGVIIHKINGMGNDGIICDNRSKAIAIELLTQRDGFLLPENLYIFGMWIM